MSTNRSDANPVAVASKIVQFNSASEKDKDRAWFSAEPIDVPNTSSLEYYEQVEVSLWVRCPLAFLCFGIAFLLPNTIDLPLRIAIGLVLVCLGLYLAREVMVWAAGLALAGLVIWGLLAGLAALTVPAAIIVGALIIAFAIRR